MSSITWTGAAGDHLFTTAANWSTDTVPGAGDDVSIGVGAGVLDTAATTVNSIALGVGTTLEIASPFTATNGTGSATSSGTFFVDNGQSFSIGGTFNNAGAVSLNSSGAATTLSLLGSTTLQGGGTITLGANANNEITYAGATSATLTNNGDTISGIGSIGSTGSGQLTIINGANGVINANATSSGTLSISAAGGLTNMGLLESSAKGLLTISNTTINNTGGTIRNVNLLNSTVNGGVIAGATMSGTATVNGGGSSGPVTVAAGTTLTSSGTITFKGEIDNFGTIENLGQLNGFVANISGSVMLNGTGGLSGQVAGVTGAATDTLINGNSLRLSSISNVSLVNNGSLALVTGNTLNNSVTNSTLVNNYGGTISTGNGLGGSYTISQSGSSLINNGAFDIVGGTGTISLPITGSGTLVISNTTFSESLVTNPVYGKVFLTNNFQNNIVFQSVDGFYGGQEVGLSQAYTGTISGFTLKDMIDLTSTSYSLLKSFVWQPNGTGGVLTIESIVGVTLASLNFSDPHTAQDFKLSNDGNGGILITDVKTAASANDLFANGLSTLLWQSTSGATAGWTLQYTPYSPGDKFPGPYLAVNQGFGLPTLNSTSHIVGAGDFNGDGYDDILVQDSATGIMTQWLMNGSTVTSQNILLDPGYTWRAVALGDFNGDGMADIAFQNTDGTVAIWDMNGGAIQASAVLIDPGAGWHLLSTGDFDGDGRSQLLFQNDDGSVDTWEMNGVTPLSGTVIQNPGPSWHVEGTGDFNGDGHADILFQSDSGLVAIWEMSNSTTALAEAIIGNTGTGWHVAAIGDYTGSGMSDIMFQNNATGSLEAWIMNGLTISQQIDIATNPGTSWHPII